MTKLSSFHAVLNSLVMCALFTGGCHFGDIIYGIETPIMSTYISAQDLEVEVTEDVVLPGVLHAREEHVQALGFRVSEQIEEHQPGEVVEEGVVVALDGAFDEDEEEFEIALEETPPEGDYVIEVFAIDEDDFSHQQSISRHFLHIIPAE